MKVLKLLYPGMHLKRWLLVLMIGLLVLVLGAAYVLVEVYRSAPLPEEAFWVTLQFLPRPLRALLFVGVGAGLITWALWRLNRSLIDALAPGQSDIVETIYNFRARQRGPKVVAIGGGTGLSMLLRGLKDYTSNITAIVTVADDGGSSGRLRRELGVLPPGDFRNCLVALADVEPLMGKLFQYRFDSGSALDGHSFGNLFIVAMTEVAGNFEEAVRETSRVLAVRGQILPATLSALTICARTEDGSIVRGESSITEHGHVKEIFL
ncbi:MAG TPA: gluconeogenesis factor YvcK family protein, partial [Chloroflexota bacterium]